MNRGMYIAGTGMLSQRTKMDVITNNMVNSDTIAFRSDGMATRGFEQVLISRINENNTGQATNVGGLGLGTHIDESYTSFEFGGFEYTEEPTDLAIAGDGFFVVQTPEGQRYTRAGNFTLTPDGQLVTPEGYRLLDTDEQPITLEGKDFTVEQTGAIQQNGEVVAQINVVQFADNADLLKAGENLFMGGAPQAGQNYTIKQGFVEGSNVNVAREMTEMMLTARAFEASQRMVKMIDESIGKTVNEIARF